jgi:hypothetical protein
MTTKTIASKTPNPKTKTEIETEIETEAKPKETPKIRTLGHAKGQIWVADDCWTDDFEN